MGLGEARGTELDGRELSSRVTSKRFWLRAHGIFPSRTMWRLGTGACHHFSRDVVHLSHYRDMQSRHFEKRAHWNVLAELRCFQGLLLLLVLTMVSCDPFVLQSDASLHGWALAHSFWPLETVAWVARTPERNRSRRIGAHSAHESALVAA